VLVLDNSSVHTSKLVLEVLEELGFEAVFLPVYSPDFNPIEFMWTYVKAVLRKLKARTEEALIDAAVVALNCVTPELVATWFKHCNYTPFIQSTKSRTAICKVLNQQYIQHNNTIWLTLLKHQK
jgi:transposase